MVAYALRHEARIKEMSDYLEDEDIEGRMILNDRLCGLVVKVHGYRPTGPGFDFQRYQIF
jgi:hypothetical protein